MSSDASSTGGGGPRQRDPERTKAEILNIATEEFANRGFAGARIDEIAAKTRTTKRMIYYYFGSKEKLYVAALQRSYENIRVTEQNVDVASLDPVSAVRQLAEFTFDRHEANPTFSRLVSHENVQKAQFVTAASGFPGLDRPIIKMFGQVLERGRADGVFRRDIDAVDLHMLISSFCFFRINNRYTFAANFGRNLVQKSRRPMYRQMIGDVVVEYLTSPVPEM
ncbi:MAG TPA: TetR/AcrR family transcriptional regulator [Acidimicrobiales bacterium]|nr:TetR/AcrR family transcriptional regulator [Acidimicrobiales bacterium]